MARGTIIKYAHIASLLLVFAFTTSITFAQSGDRIFICHFNQSEGYVLIEVPPQAMNGHFDASGNPLHEGDYISDVPSCGIGGTPTPTPTQGGPPVPEPLTILLFGAGVSGVGYAVRRLRGKTTDTQE